VSTGGIVLVALAIAVGLVGIVVPLLPGTLLVFGAIAVWAVLEHSVISWVTLGVAAAVLAVSTLIKYLWPVRRMRAADVSTWSLVAGAVLGIIGFFVIPVLGLVIGFVLGVYLAELAHRRDQRVAWTLRGQKFEDYPNSAVRTRATSSAVTPAASRYPLSEP